MYEIGEDLKCTGVGIYIVGDQWRLLHLHNPIGCHRIRFVEDDGLHKVASGLTVNAGYLRSKGQLQYPTILAPSELTEHVDPTL